MLLPVLVLILVGVVDMARAYSAYVAVTNASREGAREGMNAPGKTAAEIQAIKNRAKAETGSQGVTLTDSEIAVECSNSGGGFAAGNCPSSLGGDRVRVTINHSFQLITAYMFGGSPVSMKGQTIMVISR